MINSIFLTGGIDFNKNRTMFIIDTRNTCIGVEKDEMLVWGSLWSAKGGTTVLQEADEIPRKHRV